MVSQMSNRQLYDQDFFAWANEQAVLLRARRLSEADIDHIAEEIESMGRSEKRELVSRLRVLLAHLLKWQFQASRRGPAWKRSIVNTRDELDEHLGDNPSLKSQLPGAIETAYRRARLDASTETRIGEAVFPQTCPWTYDEIMDPAF